jgi:hypothetical protein
VMPSLSLSLSLSLSHSLSLSLSLSLLLHTESQDVRGRFLNPVLGSPSPSSVGIWIDSGCVKRNPYEILYESMIP